MSDDEIVINYCILYAKQFIYLEKRKDNKEQNALNTDFCITCPSSNIH